jgi:hypothetical protein
MKFIFQSFAIVLSVLTINVGGNRSHVKAVQSLNLNSDIDCYKLVNFFPNCNISIGYSSFVHDIKDKLPAEIGMMKASDIYSLEIASFCLGVLLTMVAVNIRFSLSHDEIEELLHSEK